MLQQTIVAPTCACVGVRTCLLCEGKKGVDLAESQLSEDSVVFWYDPANRKAVRYDCDGGVQKRMKFYGVDIWENFITEAEEVALVDIIDKAHWKPSQSGRQKQDFGPKVNFKKRKVKTSCFTGLPSYIKPYVDRMRNLKPLCDFRPVELCNLDYAPERGSAIDPHFDDSWLWGERLVTLNLLSYTYLTMTLDRTSGHETCHVTDDVIVKVPLQRRSLVVLSGDARHKWKHSISREDIVSRRLCCTLRELSDEFVTGKEKDAGEALLDIANSYCGNVVF